MSRWAPQLPKIKEETDVIIYEEANEQISDFCHRFIEEFPTEAESYYPTVNEFKQFQTWIKETQYYELSHRVADLSLQKKYAQINQCIKKLYSRIFGDLTYQNTENKNNASLFDLWVLVVRHIKYPRLQVINVRDLKSTGQKFRPQLNLLDAAEIFRTAVKNDLAQTFNLLRTGTNIQVPKFLDTHLPTYFVLLIHCMNEQNYIPNAKEQFFLIHLNLELHFSVKKYFFLILKSLERYLIGSLCNMDTRLKAFNFWKDLVIKMKLTSAEIKNAIREFKVDDKDYGLHYQIGHMLLILDDIKGALKQFKQCNHPHAEIDKKQKIAKLTVLFEALKKLVADQSKILQCQQAFKIYINEIDFCITHYQFIPNDEQLEFLFSYQPGNKLIENVLLKLFQLSKKEASAEIMRLQLFIKGQGQPYKPLDCKTPHSNAASAAAKTSEGVALLSGGGIWAAKEKTTAQKTSTSSTSLVTKNSLSPSTSTG